MRGLLNGVGGFTFEIAKAVLADLISQKLGRS
jgi:hypothetical protein